jgi:hypothetical protein
MNTITESPAATFGEDIDTEIDPAETFIGNVVVDTNGPLSEAGLNLRNPAMSGSVVDDAIRLRYMAGLWVALLECTDPAANMDADNGVNPRTRVKTRSESCVKPTTKSLELAIGIETSATLEGTAAALKCVTGGFPSSPMIIPQAIRSEVVDGAETVAVRLYPGVGLRIPQNSTDAVTFEDG